MTEYIKREDIFKYPIRMNHYDEKMVIYDLF